MNKLTANASYVVLFTLHCKEIVCSTINLESADALLPLLQYVEEHQS